jgi:iron(III) transport system ATP-binding protein
LTPALDIQHVSKSFKGNESPAVYKANLQLQTGKVLGLLGESGCGKTTLLRMIAGFETPDTGTILISGETAVSPEKFTPPGKRNIGMIFQDFALFPHMNVMQNLLFGVKSKDKAERKSISENLLKLTNLNGLESRFPRELSGGQQQRLALARCLATSPRLILLDEPFSNLDVTLREQVRNQVGELLKATQTAAVLVTHDIDDAVALCDEIAVMKSGEILQIAPFEDLYANPASEYVSRLTGAVTDLTEILKAISPEEYAQFNAVLIRPHHLKTSVNEGKITTKVLNRKFVGKGYEYLLKSDNFEFTIYSPQKAEPGSTINLDFDTHELLKF